MKHKKTKMFKKNATKRERRTLSSAAKTAVGKADWKFEERSNNATMHLMSFYWFTLGYVKSHAITMAVSQNELFTKRKYNIADPTHL